MSLFSSFTSIWLLSLFWSPFLALEEPWPLPPSKHIWAQNSKLEMWGESSLCFQTQCCHQNANGKDLTHSFSSSQSGPSPQPGNLLEEQILRPTLMPTTAETLRVRPRNPCSNRMSRGFLMSTKMWGPLLWFISFIYLKGRCERTECIESTVFPDILKPFPFPWTHASYGSIQKTRSAPQNYRASSAWVVSVLTRRESHRALLSGFAPRTVRKGQNKCVATSSLTSKQLFLVTQTGLQPSCNINTYGWDPWTDEKDFRCWAPAVCACTAPCFCFPSITSSSTITLVGR